MAKEKIKQIRTNSLYWYANKYTQNLTDAEEIQKIDMTDIFIKELYYQVENGELVNININGRVRTGKSTLAMTIGEQIIWKALQKSKQRPKTENFGMKNIARDQQEYNKMMREPETAYTVICIDENNDLENTGENSSIEKAMERTISNVHAGRYVHKIACSPKDTIDDNADIIITTIGIDKPTATTHANLYYKYIEAGQENIQLLGYIRISVWETVKNWESKVKKHFYKPERNKNDEKIIEEWKKKDWYVEYVTKKHEKMELITQEGILRPRMLDYSEIILSITKKLKNLTKIDRIIDNNMIKNTVKAVARERRIPMSIMGEELITREIQGVLKLYENFHKLNKRLNGLKTKKEILRKNRDKMQNNEYYKARDNLKEEIKEIETIKNAIAKTAEDQIEELERYKEINEKYQTMEN